MVPEAQRLQLSSVSKILPIFNLLNGPLGKPLLDFFKKYPMQ